MVFDVLARVLRRRYPLVYASNITDVDDKINQAAADEGVPIATVARRWTGVWREDMEALGVLAPDRQPLATEHVPQMIGLIESLLKSGHAYEAEGHVLFRVGAYAAYGELSGRNRDEQIAGARVDVAPYKEDPGRLRALEAVFRRAARLGEPLGARAPRLAPGVLGHGPRAPGRDDRHSRRRPGPDLPAPRKRDRPEPLRPRRRRWPATGCTTA